MNIKEKIIDLLENWGIIKGKEPFRKSIFTEPFPLTYYQRGRYHETPTWKDMVKDMKSFGMIKQQQEDL